MCLNSVLERMNSNQLKLQDSRKEPKIEYNVNGGKYNSLSLKLTDKSKLFVLLAPIIY